MYERNSFFAINVNMPTIEQKINLFNSTLWSTHKNIKSMSNKIKISVDFAPVFLNEIIKDTLEFSNKEGKLWLQNILISMINSILIGQSSDDWLAEQLKPYEIYLFNAGYDGFGRCFNQAFGLLNCDPSSLFKKIKFPKDQFGQVEALDAKIHQKMFEDYIQKNCEEEISLKNCEIGDLVFYEKNNVFQHVSLVIAIKDNNVYLLSKQGSVPSMIHTHDKANYNLGNTHFYRTKSTVKDSNTFREVAEQALNVIPPKQEKQVSFNFDSLWEHHYERINAEDRQGTNLLSHK